MFRSILFLLTILTWTGVTPDRALANQGLTLEETAHLPPLTKVAELLRRSLGGVADLRGKVQEHYITLQLLDGAGNWQGARVSAAAPFLLPADLSRADVEAFIGRMEDAARQNTYLMNFLQQAAGGNFPRLAEKVREEGGRVLADVTTLAYAIDRLSAAMRHDWRLIEECLNVWKTSRNDPAHAQDLSLFEQVKIVSVEITVEKLLFFFRSGWVNPWYTKALLPLNVAEAVLEDLNHGNQDNAAAGTLLAGSLPGHGCSENRCPARWSEDGGGILISLDRPQKYADLYQTWNMAFVTTYGHYPYFLSKLAVPQLAAYQDSPEEFIFNRITTLYTYINFEYFDRLERAGRNEPAIDWLDEDLTALWGKVNRESALDYRRILGAE